MAASYRRGAEWFSSVLDGMAALGPVLKRVFGVIVAAVLLLVVLAVYKAYGFGLASLVGILCALGMLIFTDMVSRRGWERDLAGQLTRLARENDRMARDLSRTRNELAGLKQGLARTGMELRQQAGHGYVAEARMLQAIIDRLAELGAATPGMVGGAAPLYGDTQAPPRKSANESAAPMGDLDDSAMARRAAKAAKAAAKPASTGNEKLDLLTAAVRDDNVHLFAQNIVTLPQRKTRFAEFYTRLRDRNGDYLAAQEFMDLAKGREMVPAIDNLLLLRCIQKIREAVTRDTALDGYFCNIAPETLNDAGFMNDLVEFIAQNRDMAHKLVFEMAQGDLAALGPAVVQVLDGLSRLGCRFSMDRVPSLGLDMRFLTKRHIRFLKLDAPIVLQAIRDERGYRRMQRMKSELDRAGIDIIVQFVETERDLVEMLDLGIDYGQGYLFGKPAVHIEQDAA